MNSIWHLQNVAYAFKSTVELQSYIRLDQSNIRRNSHWIEICTGSPSSRYVVYATACVYRELYGKIADRKKKCVNNYLIWNKVFLPQLCRELISCADFKAILTSLVKLFETVTPPSKRMERQTTPSIASQTSLHKSLSPQREKSRIALKPTVP